MTKTIIGISGNEYRTGDHTEPVLSYTQTCLVQAIEAVGGVPLILPVTTPDLAETYLSMIDKLILTGGQNVQPHYYKEPKTIDSENYHPRRDSFEVALLKACDKPMLGICRGLQLYNVIQGGSLFQAIPNHWQPEAGNTAHQRIQIMQKDSQLTAIYKDTPLVNSFHRQAIKELAQGLTVLALSPDDAIIEAVEDPERKFLGVQWHPELLFETRQEEKDFFDYFVNSYQ